MNPFQTGPVEKTLSICYKNVPIGKILIITDHPNANDNSQIVTFVYSTDGEALYFQNMDCVTTMLFGILSQADIVSRFARLVKREPEELEITEVPMA